MLRILLGAIALCMAWTSGAQPRPLPRLQVSENQRFLVTADGKPFFWLADTAWELFHRLDREQALRYLDARARQGFNVVQAVALAELDGLTDPNPYGHLPLTDRDPARPAVTPGNDPRKKDAYDYWDHVDFIVDAANARGIYMAMLPTWGRWVKDEPIFTPEKAETYGKWLGSRYKSKGIIWVLGGDRTGEGMEAVWRAMARGIALGALGREDYSALLMTYHPYGGQKSSTWFHNDPWLSFNMQQNGHGIPGVRQPFLHIAEDYARMPVKPVLDGEPLYEDHPLGFRAKELGYSFDAHVRQYAYWDVFSGALGHTYGNHAVWQMYAAGRKPINGPLMEWHQALGRPGAEQMRHLRALIESRPFLSRVPDQTLLREALSGADHIAATRGDGYVFVYSAQGRAIRLRPLPFPRARAWWFNPRSGSAYEAGEHDAAQPLEFRCPSEGFGSDWVLVLDDAARGFAAPGAPRR
jgi:hypothetical protein